MKTLMARHPRKMYSICTDLPAAEEYKYNWGSARRNRHILSNIPGLAFHMLVPVLTEGAWNTEYDLAWNCPWCGLAYTTAI